MISVIELKRCMAGASVLGIIVGKLHYRKKLCLIILLEVDENSEVDFYYTIQPFGQPVCLKVESVGESLFDA